MLHELLARRDGDLARALRDLLPRAAEETRHGAYWAFTRHTFVSRKKGPTEEEQEEGGGGDDKTALA
ncbi:hypothetical protein CDD83_9903 [Cordyceps sp. RAO-2017]|nr:hypothetical protein CDD83_9903 [Cordyceps sp. RAO-2017]